MSKDITVTSYYDQLEAIALLSGVDLRSAFVSAGVPTSTFYRARAGADLRSDTANKIARTIRALTTRRHKNGAA